MQRDLWDLIHTGKGDLMENRPQTREEQDNQSLREINLKLKNNNQVRSSAPFFDKSEKVDFKPREMIKTTFFALARGKPPQFLFNALLMEVPKESHVFSIGDSIYTVKNVTRKLIETRPNALKEIGIDVLVSSKKRYTKD